MKQVYVFLSALVLFSVPVLVKLHAQPTPPTGKVWTMVSEISDEFDGTALNSAKWMNYHPYWSGRNPSLYLRENVSVADGYLKLKSTVKSSTQTGDWVWSSCVTSNTQQMKPGFYSEASIKCSLLGMTSAYWFQGKYSEIDVIENFGAPTAAKYQGHETHYKSNLHYFAAGWNNDQSTPWESAILKPACGTKFYTYGVWWENATTIRFYLDGKLVHTSIAKGNFDEPMYMFFDTEVFSWGIGLPTLASLMDDTKNTMLVDWVHTYKLTDAPTNVGMPRTEVQPDIKTKVKVTQSAGVLSIMAKEVSGMVNVSLFDCTGRWLLSQKCAGQNTAIDTKLFKGVCFVHIEAENQRFTQKITMNN